MTKNLCPLSQGIHFLLGWFSFFQKKKKFVYFSSIEDVERYFCIGSHEEKRYEKKKHPKGTRDSVSISRSLLERLALFGTSHALELPSGSPLALKIVLWLLLLFFREFKSKVVRN